MLKISRQSVGYQKMNKSKVQSTSLKKTWANLAKIFKIIDSSTFTKHNIFMFSFMRNILNITIFITITLLLFQPQT